MQEEREARALRGFKAAALCGKYMEAGGTTHKSWTPHIAQYILFRHVARYGDLWRFSSGALEQRGAQLKRIGSCVACFRPMAKGGKGGAKGKVYNSSTAKQIFEVNNARQSMANDPESARYASRQGKALLSGVAGQKAGRLTTKESTKVKSRLATITEEGATCSTDVFFKKGV